MSGDKLLESVVQLKATQDNMQIYENTDVIKRKSSTANDEPKAAVSTAVERSACKPQLFHQRDLISGQNVFKDLLEEFTDIALKRSNRPNTYCLTKAISENYLLELATRNNDLYLNDRVPLAIVRPSIVGCTSMEPEAGFIDNYNGATGPILSLLTGALQAMPGDGNKVADIVPIDMVANMLICAGYYLAEHRDADQALKRDRGAYIFNFISGNRNPLLWHLITDMIAQLAIKYPTSHLFRIPNSYFIRAGLIYDAYDLLNHKLPAFLLDTLNVKLLGKELTNKRSAMAAYQRIRQMTVTLTPFTSNQWRFSDSNVDQLYRQMTPIDRRLFRFDVSDINWPKYIRTYIIGARLYALKDAARNLPLAVQKLRK